MRRFLFFTLSFLYFSLLHAEVPSVQRQIEHTSAAPGSSIRITMQITIPQTDIELQKAWILQESWPNDCVIRNAKWNGFSYPPIERENDDCWIFGYPDTPWEVEDGTLTYELVLPSSLDTRHSQDLTSYGNIFTYEDQGVVTGDTTIVLDEDAPFYEILSVEVRIAPGWNLLSIPWDLTEAERTSLASSGCFYGCATDASSGKLLFYQTTLPETPGTPFWYHSDDANTPVVCLSASDDTTDALMPNGGIWRDGWNLVGVVGATPQVIESERDLWLWQNGTYYRNPQKILLPGQAGWIWK